MVVAVGWQGDRGATVVLRALPSSSPWLEEAGLIKRSTLRQGDTPCRIKNFTLFAPVLCASPVPTELHTFT